MSIFGSIEEAVVSKLETALIHALVAKYQPVVQPAVDEINILIATLEVEGQTNPAAKKVADCLSTKWLALGKFLLSYGVDLGIKG